MNASILLSADQSVTNTVRKTVFFSVIAAFYFLSHQLTYADEQWSLMVAREADGTFDEESQRQLAKLASMAKGDGEVVIWLTLSRSFFPEHVGVLSPEELDKQAKLVRRDFRKILRPLIRNGNARHSANGEVCYGPSCLVAVTPKGLRAVSKDNRIAQIVGYNPQ